MEIRAKILKITGEQCQSGGGLTGWYDWSPVTVRPGSPSYNIRSVERFSCTTARAGAGHPTVTSSGRGIQTLSE